MILLEKEIKDYFNKKGSDYSKVLVTREFKDQVLELFEEYFYPNSFKLPKYFKYKCGGIYYNTIGDKVIYISNSNIIILNHDQVVSNQTAFDKDYVEVTKQEYEEFKNEFVATL